MRDLRQWSPRPTQSVGRRHRILSAARRPKAVRILSINITGQDSMRVPMNTRIGSASLTSYDFYQTTKPPVTMPSDFPVIRCTPSRFDEWRFDTKQDSTLLVLNVYPFGLRAAVYQFGTAQAVFISPLEDPGVGDALARWQTFGQGAICFEHGNDAAFRGPKRFVTHAAGTKADQQPTSPDPYWAARSVMVILDEHRRSGISVLPGKQLSS